MVVTSIMVCRGCILQTVEALRREYHDSQIRAHMTTSTYQNTALAHIRDHQICLVSIIFVEAFHSSVPQN